jgi:hypothetical protein
MKKSLATLALTMVALAVALWRAPASLVAGFLPADAVRVVQLHDLTGTIWRGRALLSVVSVPPSLSISWLCRPSLAPLGVQCELGESVSAELALSAIASTLRAKRVALSVPLQVTVAGATLAASPELKINVTEVTASRNTLLIKGSVRAVDASYRLGQTDVPLGEVTIDCIPALDSTTSSCTVSSRGGSARLDGKLSLSVSKASGTLELTPSNGTTQRLTF